MCHLSARQLVSSSHSRPVTSRERGKKINFSFDATECSGILFQWTFSHFFCSLVQRGTHNLWQIQMSRVRGFGLLSYTLLSLLPFLYFFTSWMARAWFRRHGKNTKSEKKLAAFIFNFMPEISRWIKFSAAVSLLFCVLCQEGAGSGWWEGEGREKNSPKYDRKSSSAPRIRNLIYFPLSRLVVFFSVVSCDRR